MIKVCKGRNKSEGFGCGEKKEIEKGKLSLCNDCYFEFLRKSPHANEIIMKALKSAERQSKIQRNKEIKEQKAEDRRKKEEIKTLTQLKKELQTVVNFIVRHIDYEKGCISCNHGWEKEWTRQRQAGHFHDKKRHDNLRFHLFNIFVQCTICNDRYSANLDNYRKGVVSHYGQDVMDYMDSLLSKYEKRTFTIPEIRKALETAKMIKKEILAGNDYSRLEVNSLLKLY
jgi:hypothetical protein